MHNQFKDMLLASSNNIVVCLLLFHKAFFMLQVLYVGTPGKLQPHPPADKQGSRKPRVRSAGRERLESSGKLHIIVCASTGMYS